MNTKAMPLLLAALGVLLIGVVYLSKKPAPYTGQEPVACTAEAMVCPDGSAVGRSGPNCEFAACPPMTPTPTPTPIPTPSVKSGVRGTVMLGPTCPVMRDPPEAQCADKPYSTLVTVFKKSDPTHAYSMMTSDAAGKFAFELPLGEYILRAGEKVMPSCSQVEIKVIAGHYAVADISCDSGIR
jgi:hypothetical protein